MKKKWLWILLLILILILILLILRGRQGEDGDAPTEGKVAFVSSELYDGNFGNGQRVLGHEHADQRCQELAQGAGLSGTFLAWISGREGSGHGVVDRFTQASEPYVRVDGTVVADDWSDLTDGSLDNPIVVDENGATISGEMRVWTNTTTGGQAWDNSRQCAVGPSTDIPGVWTWTCGGPSWTPGDCQFQSGKFGQAGSTASDWTGTTSSNTACTSEFRLYCFEQ